VEEAASAVAAVVASMATMEGATAIPTEGAIAIQATPTPIQPTPIRATLQQALIPTRIVTLPQRALIGRTQHRRTPQHQHTRTHRVQH
jgi:hypothetical protein